MMDRIGAVLSWLGKLTRQDKTRTLFLHHMYREKERKKDNSGENIGKERNKHELKIAFLKDCLSKKCDAK